MVLPFISEQAGVEHIYSVPFIFSGDGKAFPLRLCLTFCLRLLRYLLPGIGKHSSDYRTNFAADIPMTLREEILEMLITSERIFDVYFFDQNKYLESHDHSKMPGHGPEQDPKYFWIFHNLDYKKWVQRRGEVKLLGLRGPSADDLEFAASHIVQSLRNPDAASQEGEVLLYFFYNSIRRERGMPDVASWRGMVCVWNLLGTLIKTHSTTEKSLLQTFLRNALASISDDELAKLPVYSDPIDVLRSLFCHSKPKDLWHALGQVLGGLKEPENSQKRNLTLIIDLYSKASAWEELVSGIRGMAADMPQTFRTVRILLSNLPEIGDHRQTLPSEIFLEYDKERKGMYSP